MSEWAEYEAALELLWVTAALEFEWLCHGEPTAIARWADDGGPA